MSEKPLSPAQLAMLRRLATGEVVMTVAGRNAHAFWPSDMATANMSTLHALWARGFIESIKERVSGGHEYRISDLGRAVLAKIDGERDR